MRDHDPFKDRQQELRPVLVASQYNGDYNVPNELQHMYLYM